MICKVPLLKKFSSKVYTLSFHIYTCGSLFRHKLPINPYCRNYYTSIRTVSDASAKYLENFLIPVPPQGEISHVTKIHV